jgi:methionine-gamma-lyase
MQNRDKNFETLVIHGAHDSKELLGSLTTPIFQTSTFAFDSAEQGENRFNGNEEGYVYSRLGNPTVRALEERIAALEGGEAGLAFSSGMAAVSAILFALTKSKNHIICSKGVYGCTFGLLHLMDEKYDVKHDYCEMETEEQIRKLIRPETVCIYVETPINPTMKLVDLQMVVKIAKEHNLTVVVDNTFCTPYLQRPLELGCDVVLHSATKYIGGHGDVIGGLVAGKKDFLERDAMTTRKDIGGVLSPFDAWLLLRGLKTLPVRMDRHCSNASKIFEHLKSHPKVKNAFYPGDPGHLDYKIMKKQMKQAGGLISFEIKGSKQDAQAFLNRLTFIKVAVSLGDAQTLIQHPASMTHAVVPKESRLKMGITDQLIRLSVGLEAWEDIWQDMKEALDQLYTRVSL